jgi:hypothetical protein
VIFAASESANNARDAGISESAVKHQANVRSPCQLSGRIYSDCYQGDGRENDDQDDRTHYVEYSAGRQQRVHVAADD